METDVHKPKGATSFRADAGVPIVIEKDAWDKTSCRDCPDMQFTTENMDTVDTELIPGFNIRMQSEACSIQATFIKEETETEVETHNGR